MDGRAGARSPRQDEEEVITRYFVSRDADGSVSHLARVFDNGTELWGEFFINGRWQADASATDYLFDQSFREELDADEAQAIVESLAAGTRAAPDRMAQPAEATSHQAAVIRRAFGEFFPGDGPQLPDPLPDHGSISGGDWSVRFALNTDENGDPRLDFFAENRFFEPLFGQVSHDGHAVTLDSFVQYFSYDPDVDGDKSAAEQRMLDHNQAVERALKSRRLA